MSMGIMRPVPFFALPTGLFFKNAEIGSFMMALLWILSFRLGCICLERSTCITWQSKELAGLLLVNEHERVKF